MRSSGESWRQTAREGRLIQILTGESWSVIVISGPAARRRSNEVAAGGRPDPRSVRSTLDTAHTVQVTYVIVFFVMYALFVSWIAGVEHGLVEAGDRRGLRRRPAMIFWYFGLALSVVATLALYANALPLRESTIRRASFDICTST